MPELPSALGDLVGEHRPSDAPPFEALVRRRSRRRRTRAGLAIVAVGLAVPAVVLPLSLGGDSDAERLAGPSKPLAASVTSIRACLDTRLSCRDVTAPDEVKRLLNLLEQTTPLRAEECPPTSGAPAKLYLASPRTTHEVVVPRCGGTQRIDGAERPLTSEARNAVFALLDAPAKLQASFAVTYAQGSYDPSRDEALRAHCVALPGAAGETAAESFPPQVTVAFSGTVAQRSAVLACLRALPGATVLERATDTEFGDSIVESSDSKRADDPKPDGKQQVFVLPSAVSDEQRAELYPCVDRPGLGEVIQTASRVEIQATGDAASRKDTQRCLEALPFHTDLQVLPEEPFIDPNSAAARAKALPATFRLDPTWPYEPEVLSVALLVREQSCASGRLATGRIAPAVVTYTPTEVRVALSAVPVAGGGRCPLNPETPFVLFLREGLDGRPVIDANAR
jgi:hypothetical protein